MEHLDVGGRGGSLGLPCLGGHRIDSKELPHLAGEGAVREVAPSCRSTERVPSYNTS